MVKSKKIIRILPFIMAAIYPFGQLLSLPLTHSIKLHALDVFVAAFTIVGLTKPIIILPELRKQTIFLLVILITFVFSFAIFHPHELMVGSLYLLRFVIYNAFAVVIFQNLGSNLRKDKLLKSLLIGTTFVALFGLVQYFIWPDMTSLKHLGWDDHLFRLTSTFLDPAFTGIVLVMGIFISFGLYQKKGNLLYIAILALQALALLLTYSRSSYLAFIVGSAIYLLSKKKLRYFVGVLIFFLFAVAMLPRPDGWGVRLERTHSIYSKIDNTRQGVSLFKESPVFGFGYNNICNAKARYLSETNFRSHSCSGFDNSIITIMTTSGTIGLIAFTDLVLVTAKKTSKDLYGKVFIVSTASVFIHMLFTNTLFYPWVMYMMAIMFAMSRKATSRNER